MNKKQLFTSLNQLCKDLDHEYNINCGGCCYVAAVIAEFLEKYDIHHTVIHYNKYGCHYAIRVSDRIINRCDYKYREISSDCIRDSKELYSIYNEGGWNSTYDPRDNLIVKTKIKSLFKKYENRGKRFCNGRHFS